MTHHDDSTRGGDFIEYKQDQITRSKYHDQIEHGDEDVSHDHEDEPEVRYWSDFNRLYYNPKTVQRLPDVADWEYTDGGWREGQEAFRCFDEVSFPPPCIAAIMNLVLRRPHYWKIHFDLLSKNVIRYR